MSTSFQLENPRKYSRNYHFDSCSTSRDTVQILVVLKDYQYDVGVELEDDGLIHHMEVLWEICPRRRTILTCNFRLILGPTTFCTSLPKDGSCLQGVPIDKKLSTFIRAEYKGISGCTHITSILLASIPVLFQAVVFCSALPKQRAKGDIAIDKLILKSFKRSLRNTCHTWGDCSPLLRELNQENTNPILRTIDPKKYYEKK